MTWGGNLENKKIIGLTALLFVFVGLVSGIAYAGGFSGDSSSFDVSIDRVIVNGRVVAESKSNLLPDADVFSVVVDFTTRFTLEKAHIEAVLRGRQSGNSVADSTSTFDLARNQSSSQSLTLRLIDRLRSEDEFDLTIKIIDARGRSEQKNYVLKTKGIISGKGLDVSIDRVRVNGNIVASSKTNFIDEEDEFDILVDFTALEALENARVEAVLRDLRTGFSVADATANFNQVQDTSGSKALKIVLIDQLKKSNAFELTVRIVNTEGDEIRQAYGIRMEDGAVAGTARGLDISIDSVEVEDNIVAENENNFIIISEGKKDLDVDIRLTSLENVKNAHIDAILAFENGDVVADATATFNIGKNEKTLKKLELPLIGRFEQSSFRLKVKVVDAEGDFEEKVYGLKISQKKFPFTISSISLNPESAEAGKSLDIKLHFKNSGVVPLDGISASVSIPELAVSSTKFIGQIKNSQQSESTGEFLLKIPDNAETGTYTVSAEIFSQFGGESEIKEIPVYILGKTDQLIPIVNEKLRIVVPITKQDIKNDGSEVIYPLTFTNEGPDSNIYTLLLDDVNWVNLRLAESNVFVLKQKQSKTINVYASSKAASIGERIFLVTVKSNDNVLKQIQLKGNIAGTAVTQGLLSAKLKNLLEIFLIGAVVLFAAIGLFFGTKKLIQKDSSEEISDTAEEAYY